MKAQLLSQGMSYERTSETGSLPRIHLSITRLQAMFATKAQPYGPWDVTPSRIGRRLVRCCGFMENVQSDRRLPRFFFALANGPLFL